MIQIKTIPIRLRPLQKILVADMAKHRFSVVIAHRRFGKTVLAIATLIKLALTTKKSHSKYGYLAPFRHQAKTIAWEYLKRYCAAIDGVAINESELSVTLPNGSQIRLFGADNPDALRGTYFDFVVIDEIADMRPELWGEVIRPALSDRKGGALFIGTPKGMNLLYELFLQAQKLDGWMARLYTASQTDIIDAEELQSARLEMTDAQYRQEYECDFTASCEDVLISIDLIQAARGKFLRSTDIDFAPVILGVDVARFGSDRSVMCRRQGKQVFNLQIYKGVDNMTISNIVAGQIIEHNPDAVFIDAGAGQGVIDRLRQLGHNVIEVNFSGSASKPLYKNKRIEMWDDVRLWLVDGGSLPDDSVLCTELSIPKYKWDRLGKKQLESKEDIKARVGYSPDLADALALTFAMPVVKKEHQIDTQQQMQNFDIFATY